MQIGLSLSLTLTRPGREAFPATGPTLDLNFVDESQPTLSLDFTSELYAVYAPDSTNSPAGAYRIWS